MKNIQITMDETLLASLDATPEARTLGRSAVFRQLLQAFLEERRAANIKAQYQKAYTKQPGLGEEWAGWTKEGSWPRT